LLTQWGDDGSNDCKSVPLVRLDGNELGIVPFTTSATAVRIHYCQEPEIQGYVRCNGPGCVLCLVGRKAEDRTVLPVYVPAYGAVCALPISPFSRPGALRPQIMPILRSGKRVVVFIRRADRAKFEVSTVDLGEGKDDGTQAIADFKQRWETGEIDLALVYQRPDNCDLAQIPNIASMLRLKGLDPDNVS
jgi:hypothetical protein